MPDAGGGLHEAEMLDHDIDRQAGKARRQLGQLVAIDQQLQMPLQRFDPVGQYFQMVEPDIAGEIEIEADAAHADMRDPFQFLVRNIGRHHRHAAQAVAVERQRLQQAAIIGAVGARLHQHAAAEPERRQHLAILRERRFRRRIGARRALRKQRRRADHMALAVARALGQREARRPRGRVRTLAGRDLVLVLVLELIPRP